MSTSAVNPCGLYQLNGVNFLHAPSITPPLFDFQSPAVNDQSHFLIPIETAHHAFYPQISDIGGIMVGVGSLQNLSMAAVAKSSHLFMVDRAPGVARNLLLICSLIPLSGGNRRKFIHDVRQLVVQGTYGLLPPDRADASLQRPIMRHVTDQQQKPATLLNMIHHFENDPHSFMADDTYFERIYALAMRGALTVVYADLFCDETLDIMHNVFNALRVPIRAVYLSNALQFLAIEEYPYQPSPRIRTLSRLLSGTHTDPDGVLLTADVDRWAETLGRKSRFKIDGAEYGDWQYHYYTCRLREADDFLRTTGSAHGLIHSILLGEDIATLKDHYQEKYERELSESERSDHAPDIIFMETLQTLYIAASKGIKLEKHEERLIKMGDQIHKALLDECENWLAKKKFSIASLPLKWAKDIEDVFAIIHIATTSFNIRRRELLKDRLNETGTP